MYEILIVLTCLSCVILSFEHSLRKDLRRVDNKSLTNMYYLVIKTAVEDEVYYRFILNYYLTEWGCINIPAWNAVICIIFNIIFYRGKPSYEFMYRCVSYGFLAYYLSSFTGLVIPVLIHIIYAVFSLMGAQILITTFDL